MIAAMPFIMGGTCYPVHHAGDRAFMCEERVPIPCERVWLKHCHHVLTRYRIYDVSDVQLCNHVWRIGCNYGEVGGVSRLI